MNTTDSRSQDTPLVAGRWLLWTAAAFAVAAALLLIGGGYEAGFFAINDAARVLSDGELSRLTQLGDSLTALSLFLIFAWRYPRALWLAVLGALIATALSHGIKPIAHLSRPPAVLDLELFRHLGPLWKRDSFPSGHTVTAFVVAGALACELRVTGRVLLLGAALLVGLSRVAAGVHWPVDVLAGAALGLVSVRLGGLLMQRWRWGLRPFGHRLLVLALAGCAIADFIRVPSYPGAHGLTRLIAVLGLALSFFHYVILPRLQARMHGARAATQPH
ncbi:phosphatase PAP2 family protein [Solimonas variicoloris]|uniref:phosphatase PAP2 family protein n=1 Tax=Solimonas variicoloris TaxID=254408 RepID=UPI00036B9037|nr:phosphatase PAP2 family protein [Solimonas variicoloris]